MPPDNWSHGWQCEAYRADGSSIGAVCVFIGDVCWSAKECGERLATRAARSSSTAPADPAAVAELQRLFNPRTGLYPVPELAEHQGADVDEHQGDDE